MEAPIYVRLLKERWRSGHRSWYEVVWKIAGESINAWEYGSRIVLERIDKPDCLIVVPREAFRKASPLELLALQSVA